MRRTSMMLFLIALCATQAFAWGPEGHRIVCRIALLSLSPTDHAEVSRLAKAYVQPPGSKLVIDDFPAGCSFPDEARGQVGDAERAGNTTSPWKRFDIYNESHFLNVDRTVRKIPADPCPDKPCVVTAIPDHEAKFKAAANDQERAEALLFLGHWLGDIHQPLHVSYADDKGGNDVKPITGDFYPLPKQPAPPAPPRLLTLHSVWDGSIIRKVLADAATPDDLAFVLHAKITADERSQWLAAATPVEWAQESYDITTSKDAQYCHRTSTSCDAIPGGRVLGAKYQKKNVDDIELRLQQAGVRLAALIEKVLHP